LLSQAQSARDSLSGVNLDEEAANMLKFQQAYQASSKILQIGNTLFDTILSLG
jgi:flagellar hook-associated protein 1